MPMHGHFYTPLLHSGTHLNPSCTHDSWAAKLCGPTNQWRLPVGRFGGVGLGRVGMGVRVNRRARSAPLSLSGRAHITAVIMWSCLPLHTPTTAFISVFLFCFSTLTNSVLYV